MTDLSPTERLVFALLRDGFAHTKKEVREHLGDALMEDSAVRKQISLLRGKINRHGLEIVHRAAGYQLVRLLHSAYDGKR